MPPGEPQTGAGDGTGNRGDAMRRSAHPLVIGFLAAAGIIRFSGCATFPPPREAIADTRTYPYAFQEVRDAVLSSLSEMNVGIRSTEKEPGKIVAQDDTLELRQFEPGWYDAKSCYCGPPARGTVLRDLTGTYVISLVRESPRRTAVTIDATYQASMYAGDAPAGMLSCPSKGIFEPFLLDRVETRLAAGDSGTHSPFPLRRDNDSWWKPARGY